MSAAPPRSGQRRERSCETDGAPAPPGRRRRGGASCLGAGTSDAGSSHETWRSIAEASPASRTELLARLQASAGSSRQHGGGHRSSAHGCRLPGASHASAPRRPEYSAAAHVTETASGIRRLGSHRRGMTVAPGRWCTTFAHADVDRDDARVVHDRRAVSGDGDAAASGGGGDRLRADGGIVYSATATGSDAVSEQPSNVANVDEGQMEAAHT